MIFKFAATGVGLWTDEGFEFRLDRFPSGKLAHSLLHLARYWYNGNYGLGTWDMSPWKGYPFPV